jgi:hypothetical protein
MSSEQGPHIMGMRTSASAGSHRHVALCEPLPHEEVAV